MKYLIFSFMYLIYYLIKSNRTLQFLQQNRYNRGGKFNKYINAHLKKIYINIDLLFIPIVLIVSLFAENNYPIIFAIFYFIISYLTHIMRKKEQKKLPLVYTKRIQRLYVTLLLFYVILLFSCFHVFGENSITTYIYLWFFIYIDHFVAIACNVINTPVEKLVGLYFKNKAVRKLSSMSSMDVIGITGSYGKTSSKNILSDILNIKYNAMPTPKNFNTPYGLMMTINNNLDKFNDYFIAEMGACKKGEIKELCDLVKPKYGILTKIGVAHLETFGSQENIQKTKFELVHSLPSDGIAVLNADDPLQLNYKGKFNCKVLWIGIDNTDVDLYAYDIKLSGSGTSFKCKFKDSKKVYEFSTKLLGKANIYNILAAVLLGKNLGISEDALISAVKQVQPVEHRLQLKKYMNMNLIDDAYNANPDGCKMALDALSLMKGKKIVISSGMIELSDLSDKLHYELGEYMSDKTDIAVLIGKEQTKEIYNGLLSKGFDKKNIHTFNNIMDAFTLIQKIGDNNTYVLLQSDLPDIFNEK